MAVSDPEAIVQAAAGLASRRDYEAAKAMLDRLEPTQETRQANLLRAKIAAQQRQFDLAIDLWRQILEENPQDAEAREAIRLAEKMRRSRTARFLFGGRMYRAAALVIAVPLVIGALVWTIPTSRGPRLSPARQAGLPEQLEPIKQALPSPSDRQEDRYQLLAAEISRLQASAEASDRRAQADALTLSKRVETLADIATRLEARVQSDSEQLAQLVQALARSRASWDAQAQTELKRLAQDVTQLAGDLNTHESAERQSTESLVSAVNELAKEQNSHLAAIRTDFSRAVALSKQMEDLTAAFRMLEKKFWGPSASERRIILRSLNRLQQDIDTLTTSLERQ